MPDVKVYIRARQKDGADKTELRLAIEAAGLSSHRLEALTGINHQHINNVARGMGGMERKLADRLAAALGVPVGDLFVHYAEGIPAASGR